MLPVVERHAAPLLSNTHADTPARTHPGWMGVDG